jgi:hypothetical protein
MGIEEGIYIGGGAFLCFPAISSSSLLSLEESANGPREDMGIKTDDGRPSLGVSPPTYQITVCRILKK